ncbi:invasin, partial [Xenorhabdus sp. 12]
MDKENRCETGVNNTSFIRRIAWVNIAFQSLFPIVVSFSPAMAADTDKQINKESKIVPISQGYTIQENETLNDVSKKTNATIDQIKAVNPQLSLFSDNALLTPGESIVIPERKKWLKLPDAQQETKQQEPTEQEKQLAHVVERTGHFLKSDPSIDRAADLVRSSLVSKANGEIEQWLRKFGHARVQLNLDKKFSLAGSQFDGLFPLWEQKENLIFNQSSLHKTDGRTQVNLGLGWRYFTPEYMYGNNIFFDHDLSRQHSRVGLGVEYWRDYLKLSANGYLKISDWKDSPEIEDYRARPANGWDIRAEGYLKHYPQLGAKLMYEKYYGHETGLFGKDKRQNNPQALTAGITYTPVPLITLGAERKQGNSGQHDTKLNLQINYQFGMSWAKQISTEAVSQLRTLAANRYSFVDRNNNIVLEYQKKEVINLRLDKEINGYAGEEKPLNVAVTSKYGLARIDWDVASLVANGGSVVEKEHHDYHIFLPNYQYGKDAKNTYQISAVAIDKKGNRSSRVFLQVIVSSAAIDTARSRFLPEKIEMPADGKSTRQVILEIRDKNNSPIDVDVRELHLQIDPEHKTQASRSTDNPSVQVSAFQRIDVAKYALIVTAGTRPERVKLTPFSRNVAFSFAHVITKANEKTAQIKPDQLKILTDNVPADGVST